MVGVVLGGVWGRSEDGLGVVEGRSGEVWGLVACGRVGECPMSGLKVGGGSLAMVCG